MKKLLGAAALAVLSMVLVLPALAGEGAAAKDVTLSGYITDEWCGAKNANAEGSGCAAACAKKGANLAILSDGKMYILSNKELALSNLGHKVEVKGTLSEDGKTVNVKSIEKAKEA
jgi:hypothetical protein